jgi:hypothetical protein
MPRTRLAHPLRTLAVLVVAAAVLPAGAAPAATLPKITKVTPLKVEVGQTLTIRGSGFIPGANKNTVVFKRDGKAAVFARADSATATRIVLTVPAKVLPFLTGKGGAQAPQTFRLRVLARKFGKAFTSKGLSPVIGPPGSLGGAGADAADCDNDKVPNREETDDDNDGLGDVEEKTVYKTDTCKADTDGDGVSDAFEVESALDLNSRALPYAGKRPYPNPLDGTDPAADYDGDGLTLADEFNLWVYTTKGKLPLTYSDGDQDTSTEAASTPANGSPLDMNGDGVLTDDEKDPDLDGLSNWDESHGRLTPAWWSGVFKDEVAYFGANGTQVMSELSMIDPDTDGDTVFDGGDDQDQDGWTNLQELDRRLAVIPAGNLWVNPYNPCLPDPLSRTCTLHPPVDNPWAPFPLAPGFTSPLVTTKTGPGPLFIPKP